MKYHQPSGILYLPASHYWYFFFFMFFVKTLKAQEAVSLSGKILDKEKNIPVEYVAVGIKELNLWQYTDAKGFFSFNNIIPGQYTLVVRCLGYQSIQQSVSFPQAYTQTFYLTPLDLRISEVIVTATEKINEPGTSVIDRPAMQHLQPSGFGDLLELLPGYRWEKQNLSRINTIKLREVDNDLNTAFGTAFFIDGMPISTDGAMEGNNLSVTGLKLSGRINVANGIDMRQIPTDDIESVEIVRGIPSVKQGNLSTGAVIINRKWGTTPLTARVKADLNNKVFAVSKGFKLNNNRGIINLGTELLSYKSDPRNPLNTFLRNQTTIRYSNFFPIGKGNFSVKTGIDYLLTIDSDKEDPELNFGMKDEFRSDLSKTSFGFTGQLNMPGKVSKTVNLKLKASLTQNSIKRERLVSLTGPQPIPASMEEGENYGEYLPSRYEASFERDDRPFQLFASIDFSLNGNSEAFRHQFNSGGQWQYFKNFGEGDVFDPSRPIFPTQGGRPYNFSKIPALNILSAYAEEVFTSHLGGEHRLKIKPGIRVQMLPGLSNDFDMHGKAWLDWRGHMVYSFPHFSLAGIHTSLSLHAAMGTMTRLPSLAMLYPQEEYFDIIELNYFSQNPELRQLYVMTQIEDRTNYQLQPVQNFKKEIGLDARMGKTRLSLSLFDELLDNGIFSSSKFVSYTYDFYDPQSVSSEGLTNPPTIDLFSSEKRSRLYAFSQYVNGSLLHKQGVEFQVLTPKISAINTRITIDGAWFKTSTDISIPDFESKSIVYQGVEYPYVGIYEKDDTRSKEKELLNTNIRFDTHLSMHRLLITLAFQTTWFQKERYLPYDGVPIAYLDNEGNYHPFTDEDKEDSLLGLLVRSFTSYHFDELTVPIDMGVNLKVSKEIGNNLTLAFFVNRLVNYLPYYKLRTGATYIRSAQPYFGMELKCKI